MNTEDFNFLCGIVLSIVICFGITGNILSVIVWTKGSRCRGYTSAPYLIALALSDSCNLCFSGIVYATEYLFVFSLYDVNNAFCKVLRPAGFFFSLLSTWLIVCVTIERTVAVHKPFNWIRWQGAQKTKHFIVICSVFFICLLLELPWIIGLNVLPVNPNTTNFPDRMLDVISVKIDAANDASEMEFRNYSGQVIDVCQFTSASFIYKYETVWRFWVFDFGLIFSVPLIILTTCNLIVLMTIRRRNSEPILHDHHGNTYGEHSTSTAMTARVVAISVVHCISVGPYSVSVLIPSFAEAMNNRNESIIWLYSFFNFIWYLNHAVNFILYSLFGRAFRRDCKALCCRRRRGKSNIGKPSNRTLVALVESLTVTFTVTSLRRMEIEHI